MSEPLEAAAPASPAEKPAVVPESAPKAESPAKQEQLSLIAKAAEEPNPKDEDASGEAKAKQPEASSDLEISLPEGAAVDENMLKEFKALAKEAGLDSPTASKIVSWDLQRQKKLEASMDESVAELNKQWAKEFESDKEFGGQNFKESFAAAGKALRKFGGEELARQLDEAGIGNHPGLMKFFARVGKALGEDDSSAKGAKPVVDSKEQMLRKMFPSEFK